MAQLREATDGVQPSAGFASRVATAIQARKPSTWSPTLMLVERRGLWLTAAAGLACAVLLAVNLNGLKTLNALVINVLSELTL